MEESSVDRHLLPSPNILRVKELSTESAESLLVDGVGVKIRGKEEKRRFIIFSNKDRSYQVRKR